MATATSATAPATTAHGSVARLVDDDRGLSLVEIIIAMFLLAILSVAFLPLLVSSLQLSIRNATTSTATQLLSEQLDELVATPPTCADLQAYGAVAPATVADRRGVEYTPARSVPACDTLTYPAIVTVVLSVAIDNSDVNDVDARTSFLIERAS